MLLQVKKLSLDENVLGVMLKEEYGGVLGSHGLKEKVQHNTGEGVRGKEDLQQPRIEQMGVLTYCPWFLISSLFHQ